MFKKSFVACVVVGALISQSAVVLAGPIDQGVRAAVKAEEGVHAAVTAARASELIKQAVQTRLDGLKSILREFDQGYSFSYTEIERYRTATKLHIRAIHKDLLDGYRSGTLSAEEVTAFGAEVDTIVLKPRRHVTQTHTTWGTTRDEFSLIQPNEVKSLLFPGLNPSKEEGVISKLLAKIRGIRTGEGQPSAAAVSEKAAPKGVAPEGSAEAATTVTAANAKQ